MRDFKDSVAQRSLAVKRTICGQGEHRTKWEKASSAPRCNRPWSSKITGTRLMPEWRNDRRAGRGFARCGRLRGRHGSGANAQGRHARPGHAGAGAEDGAVESRAAGSRIASNIQVNGRQTRSQMLVGNSLVEHNAQALREQDWLVTVAGPHNQFVYAVFVAPQKDVGRLKSTYQPWLLVVSFYR